MDSLFCQILMIGTWLACVKIAVRLAGGRPAAGEPASFTRRKLVHAAVGLGVVPLVIFLREWYLFLIPVSLVFLGNMKANQERISPQKPICRRIYPTVAVLLPIVAIMYFWRMGWKPAIMLAVLAMSMGDAAAALAGRRYGRQWIPWTGKSWEGAVANFLVTLATLLAAGAGIYGFPPAWLIPASLITAGACAGLEVVVPGAWDNPLVMLAAMGLWQFLSAG